MNKKRKAPYIFLLILFIILVFIIGINYGKKVESTNKTVSLILSITPMPTATPLPLQKDLGYKTYVQAACGLQFVYPDTLTIQKESTNEAVLISNDQSPSLEVNCDKNNKLITVMKDPDIATKEMKFKNVPIKARVLDETSFTLELRNPKNGKQVYVLINKNLYPLFENTLQYLP